MSATNDFKLVSGVQTVETMDAATAIADWPAKFPPAYQSGGALEGLSTDIGTWSGPALPHTVFYECEDEVETGDRSIILLGSPYAVLYFAFLSTEQMAYMRTALCAKPARSAEVTLRAMHEDGTWGTYTGVLHWPKANEMERTAFGWKDVTFRVMGLREAESAA